MKIMTGTSTSSPAVATRGCILDRARPIAAPISQRRYVGVPFAGPYAGAVGPNGVGPNGVGPIGVNTNGINGVGINADAAHHRASVRTWSDL